MATYGRFHEINLLLESLVNQTFKNFELVIVDQNDKIDLDDLIQKFLPHLDIKKINSEKGLSRARNEGLKYVTGDIVAFPDDDCSYAPDTLEKVCRDFESQKIDSLIARSVSKEKMYDKHFEEKQEANLKNINIYNCWFTGISYTLFFSKRFVDLVGQFDERLGVGSNTEYGSGEESDFLIRGILKNLKCVYDETINVYHPDTEIESEQNFMKAFNYSRGRMFVLKKHNYNIIFVLLNIYYPLLKLLINLGNKKKQRYYWYQFIGRVKKVTLINK
jgi:glycosyltransferase involved in cell wall biosynthesis